MGSTMGVLAASAASISILSYAFGELTKSIGAAKAATDAITASQVALNNSIRDIQEQRNLGLITTDADQHTAQLEKYRQQLDDLIKQRNELADKPIDLGSLWGVVSGETFKAINDFNDQIDHTAQQISNLKHTIGLDQADALDRDLNTSRENIRSKEKAGIYDTDARVNAQKADEASLNATTAALEKAIESRNEAFRIGDDSLAARYQSLIDKYTDQSAMLRAFSESEKQAITADKAETKQDAKDRNALVTDYVEHLKDLVDVKKQLSEGGLDEQGNKVSLEDEARSKQRELDLEYEQKKLDYETKISQKRQDIVDIEKKAAEDIKKIEDEGYAVRSKTEAQDKADRIQKITDEANSKKKDAQDQIDNAQRDFDDTTRKYNNERALIENEMKAKVASLKTQQTYLDNITTIEAASLNINKQITEELVKQASLKNQKIDASLIDPQNQNAAGQYLQNNVVSSSVTSSTSRNDLKLETATDEFGRTYQHWVYKYHEGGIVPGPQGREFQTVLQGGEIVTQPDQMRQALQMAAGKALAAASGTTVSVVIGDTTYNIETHPGMDANDVATQIDAQQRSRLKALGLPGVI